MSGFSFGIRVESVCDCQPAVNRLPNTEVPCGLIQFLLDTPGKPEHVFHRENSHAALVQPRNRALRHGHDQVGVHPRDLISMTLNRKTAMIAVFTERYVLSLVYLYLTWFEFQKPWLGWSGPPATEGAVVVQTSRHLTQVLLFFFTAVLLLLARRTAVPPQKLKSILIPLATTFFTLTYGAVPWLPAALQNNLCPAELRMPVTLAAIVLIVIGPAIALWGLLHLGRSFGVFVEVRQVVLGGPYRWVRHPMYLGWICMCAGNALGFFSAAYFILVAIHILLLQYRARLEEAELSGYSAEYREHLKRTGFIFPRFRRPAADPTR
jgi:protein-S-isoprenylcysteine O-methyltransferase Ste14